GGEYRRGPAGCDDHGHSAPNQFGRHRRQSLALIFGPAIFDRYAFAFDITGLFKALPEAAHRLRDHLERCGVEEADHRHRALLRARRRRPKQRRCGRRAAGERHEGAPLHSITSSAVASSDAGTVTPSILALSALITRSSLVDCTTGRSAGLAPFRMRPA